MLDENQVHELDGWLEALITDPEAIPSVSPTAVAMGSQFIHDCIDAAKQQRVVLQDRLRKAKLEKDSSEPRAAFGSPTT